MESDLGKLFIGGISWDTDEERLKEYFRKYGEVVEAMIMRDRFTGRARGFGFIVFADPAVAERVIMDKHMIDGRTVEAKKAVPRDDQNILNRNMSSITASPGPGRTKKIFVGGLASSVTETDFKNYFDQFGTITDVVVMYDHNTQRPRGFGFITYDSEDAVDRVLHKTFHELKGKLVEVKRAVPKELSPGPARSPVIGYNYGLSRTANFLNSYAQGYNLSPLADLGVRMDGRFNPLASGRTGFPPFNNPGYGIGMDMEPGMGPNFGGSSNFDDENVTTLQAEVENLSIEERCLDEQIREMQERLRNLSEDENNQKWLFVTEEDIKSLSCFQNETLIAIKAPHGTTLEVPDPDEAVDYSQRRYRIVLRSSMGPIDVYLVSQFEEKFEEIQGADPPPNFPSTSGLNENPATTMVPEESRGKEIEMQGQDDNKMCSDLNASQDFVSGIMKIVPSDVDCDADYWLLSDPSISIIDMWRTESLIEWSELGTLNEGYGMATVSSTCPQTPTSNATEAPSANSTGK